MNPEILVVEAYPEMLAYHSPWEPKNKRWCVYERAPIHCSGMTETRDLQGLWPWTRNVPVPGVIPASSQN